MQTYNLMKSGLNAAQLRSKTIANNIANINTPNYKRKYVKFEETLNNVKLGKLKLKLILLERLELMEIMLI